MKKSALIASALAVLGASTSQARHVDIVPYHEINAQGERMLSVGSYDLTGAFDGSQPIQRNVLMFYGYASDSVPAAVPGSAVNADPGWNRPMDFHAIDEGDGLFGADYPDGTAPTGFAHLGFNAVADPRLGRNLSYWNGSGDVAFGSVPSGEIIDLYKFNPFGPPGEVVTLTGANADLTGLELTDSLSPGYHEHSVASVWGSATRAPDDQPAPGSYLYTLELALRDEVIPLPNGFVEFIPGEQNSPVFHVMLITPGLVDDSVYEYGDIIYEFQYDEFGEIVYDDAGTPLLLLDEFGNPIPVLDAEGNPLREVLSVHSPRFDAAVGWIHENLGPAVPEPSAFALTAVLMASMAGLHLRGRLASLSK